MHASFAQFPVLTDNYAYVIRAGGVLAVVDPAHAQVLAGVATAWCDVEILNTHHHGDHTGGNLALKAAYAARITGPRADAERIPGIDVAVGDGDRIAVGGLEAVVFDVPGHTRGHIAYYLPALSALFCGDTLFSLGCGRLFEGTPEQLFASLAKLKTLPPDTLVCCAHEYTAENYRFAASVDPDNAALAARGAEVHALRAAGRPTVPSTLASELACNPFLRAPTAAALGELRRRKDEFPPAVRQ